MKTIATIALIATALTVAAQETVQIGSQVWMKKNLNVGTMIQSPTKQTDNGVVEKYCYANNPDNCTVYGGLYSWDEAMQYAANPKGICPDGFHIPSQAEVTTLYTYLGGILVAGGKLKETGTEHFRGFTKPFNIGATNSTGFTALPGGMAWHTGAFYYLKVDANFWTSTTVIPNVANYFGMMYSTPSATNGEYYKAVSLSIRCIKD